jgi:hypothetical protein
MVSLWKCCYFCSLTHPSSHVLRHPAPPLIPRFQAVATDVRISRGQLLSKFLTAHPDGHPIPERSVHHFCLPPLFSPSPSAITLVDLLNCTLPYTSPSSLISTSYHLSLPVSSMLYLLRLVCLNVMDRRNYCQISRWMVGLNDEAGFFHPSGRGGFESQQGYGDIFPY